MESKYYGISIVCTFVSSMQKAHSDYYGLKNFVQELQDKYQKAKMLENLRYLENPTVMELSRILFADNQRSVWNGPHSLVKREGSARKSSIHAAISMFMQ